MCSTGVGLAMPNCAMCMDQILMLNFHYTFLWTLHFLFFLFLSFSPFILSFYLTLCLVLLHSACSFSSSQSFSFSLSRSAPVSSLFFLNLSHILYLSLYISPCICLHLNPCCNLNNQSESPPPHDNSLEGKMNGVGGRYLILQVLLLMVLPTTADPSRDFSIDYENNTFVKVKNT